MRYPSKRHLKAKSSSIYFPDDNNDNSQQIQQGLLSSSAGKKNLTPSYPKVAALFFVLFLCGIYIHEPNSYKSPLELTNSHAIHVFQSISSSENQNTYNYKLLSSTQTIYRPFTKSQQREFLEHFGKECYPTNNSVHRSSNKNILLDRFDYLQSKGMKNDELLATEIWKYCALFIHGGVYMDQDTLPVQMLEDILKENSLANTEANDTHEKHKNDKFNIAVLSSSSTSDNDDEEFNFIHDGFLFFESKKSNIANRMLKYLAGANDDIVKTQPHFVSKYLYTLIQQDVGVDDSKENDRLNFGVENKKWNLLELKCQPIQQNIPQNKTNQRVLSNVGSPLPVNFCPLFNGYCCSIHSSTQSQPLLVTRHPLPQLAVIFPDNIHDIPYPYAFQSTTPNIEYQLEEKPPQPNPYIATIREVVYERPLAKDDPLYLPTTRMFDYLFENDCLPSNKNCHKCLRSWNPTKGSCANCFEHCRCYCQVLCKYRPPEKFISKDYWIRLPHFRKHSHRIIPKIIHQTWFEDVNKEKYPNMSRLIESWKNSGWEYNFYDDDSSAAFLSTHFPPEVREAYDTLIPGAFKADLFRYCVLLIKGGVYSDMDVLLESNLEKSIPPDVGFLTPIDEPGVSVGHRMCLWNGLLAVAPGHPILAKAIELVVNNIRNRFTGVDYDDMLCPNPVLSLSHVVDMLFTAGPCILGAAFNNVLGKHMQDEIQVGETFIWDVELSKPPPPEDDEKTHFHDPRLFFPGRTIILQQEKEDMGAHRFTLVEKNMVVAATDLPDYEDRPDQESKHYSKTRVKAGVYGLDKLYKDRTQADEKIRIFIEGM